MPPSPSHDPSIPADLLGWLGLPLSHGVSHIISKGSRKKKKKRKSKERLIISPYRVPPLCGSRGIFHSPSLETDKVTDNKDFKKWIDNYLGVGEWVMDQSVVVLGSSGWFERKR